MMPMASVRNIDVIDGSPSLRARAMMGVCIAERDCDYFRELTPPEERGKRAVWECSRRGEVYRGEFSIDDATNAGLLGKTNWKGYAPDMLDNRAIARAARKAYPDKLSGVYTPDEVIDLRDDGSGNYSRPEPPPIDARKTIDAEIVDTSAALNEAARLDADRDDILESIGKAQTESDLDALLPACKALKQACADRGTVVREAFASHRALIRDAAAKDAQ